MELHATSISSLLKEVKQNFNGGIPASKHVENSATPAESEFNGENFSACFNSKPDEFSFKLTPKTHALVTTTVKESGRKSIPFPMEAKILVEPVDSFENFRILGALKHNSTQEEYTAIISDYFEDTLKDKKKFTETHYEVMPLTTVQDYQVINYYCRDIIDFFEEDYQYNPDQYDYLDHDDEERHFDNSSEILSYETTWIKVIITKENAFFLVAFTYGNDGEMDKKCEKFIESFEFVKKAS
jgi:hypothetical protein